MRQALAWRLLGTIATYRNIFTLLEVEILRVAPEETHCRISVATWSFRVKAVLTGRKITELHYTHVTFWREHFRTVYAKVIFLEISHLLQHTARCEGYGSLFDPAYLGLRTNDYNRLHKINVIEKNLTFEKQVLKARGRTLHKMLVVQLLLQKNNVHVVMEEIRTTLKTPPFLN